MTLGPENLPSVPSGGLMGQTLLVNMAITISSEWSNYPMAPLLRGDMQ